MSVPMMCPIISGALDLQTRLRDEAEERAKTCIIEGYVEGELNYEDEDSSYRGWWQIERGQV